MNILYRVGWRLPLLPGSGQDKKDVAKRANAGRTHSASRVKPVFAASLKQSVQSTVWYGHFFSSKHQAGGCGPRKAFFRCSNVRQRGTLTLD
jgi:hypothetical protein